MYKKLTVLVVDDSNVHRHLLKEMLIELNFSAIFEANNGEDGVKMAEENKPDLIIMDVVMPGINGFQATRKISLNESLKHIPVIMCTSRNEKTDKTWGEKQGAKAYVTKPVDKTVLFEEIRKLLG